MLRDLMIAGRRLRRHPKLCLPIVGMLALVIAAEALAIAWARGLILDPLPFDAPDRLVRIYGVDQGTERTRLRLSQAAVEIARENVATLTSSGAARNMGLAITETERPTNPLMREVTEGWFRTLGVEPMLGRSFDDTEYRQGQKSVILEYGFWQTYYNGNPEVLGQSLELANLPYEIVGISSPSFSNPVFPLLPALWIPIPETAEPWQTPENFILVGRLKEGVGTSAVQDELGRVSTLLQQRYPDSHSERTLRATPLEISVTEAFRPSLPALLGAAVVILLIAFSNIASLWLARMRELGQEGSVRMALGAPRASLFRLAMAETLLLSFVALILGLGGALLALEPLKLLAPSSIDLPLLDQVRIDAVTVLSALAIATLHAMLLAFLSLRAFTASTEKLGGRGHRQLRGTKTPTRNGLVVAEIALSLTLLVAAGATLKALADLRQIGLGFEPASAMGGRTGARGPGFESPEGKARFHQSALAELAELPGVRSVGACEILPMFANGYGGATRLATETTEGPRDSWPEATTLRATPGYFEAIGQPIVAGRGFSWTDTADQPGVVIVTQSLARRLWGRSEPLGRSLIADDGQEKRTLQVVGIAADLRGLADDPSAPPLIFLPHAQSPTTYMVFFIRVEGPFPPISAVEDAIWRISPEAPVYSVATLGQVVRDIEWRPRILSQALTTLGFFALILAMSGIFAVLAYQVAERQAEIGLRMAIGASHRQVVLSILRQTAVLTSIGLVVGGVGAVLGGRILASRLDALGAFDGAFDGRILLAAAALLALAALAASLLPARRATRIDPAIALKG